jgi:hypothetical protein
MALQTEIVVSFREHLIIDASVRRMAGAASLAHCFVLKGEWAALTWMTFHTPGILAQ